MDIFLKSHSFPRTVPGRSFRRIPEEGIAIIVDDSFMCVTIPEDLPVGQDVREKTVLVMILILSRPKLTCVLVFNKKDQKVKNKKIISILK